jgi:hypothetical protein
MGNFCLGGARRRTVWTEEHPSCLWTMTNTFKHTVKVWCFWCGFWISWHQPCWSLRHIDSPGLEMQYSDLCQMRFFFFFFFFFFNNLHPPKLSSSEFCWAVILHSVQKRFHDKFLVVSNIEFVLRKTHRTHFSFWSEI